MLVNQEEPVSSPRHVTSHFSITRNSNGHVSSATIARHIVHGHFARLMQNRTHHTNGSLDPMFPGSDAIQVVESGDQTDRSVAAHAEIANVVKEDHAGSRGTIHRFAEECAHNHI